MQASRAYRPWPQLRFRRHLLRWSLAWRTFLTAQKLKAKKIKLSGKHKRSPANGDDRGRRALPWFAPCSLRFAPLTTLGCFLGTCNPGCSASLAGPLFILRGIPFILRQRASARCFPLSSLQMILLVLDATYSIFYILVSPAARVRQTGTRGGL